MNPPASLVIVAGTLQVGGAERQLYAQCAVLAAEGAAPTVVFLEDGPWHRRLAELGVGLVDLSTDSSRLCRLTGVLSVARCRGCTVLQSSHGFTNVYVALAGWMLGLPTIGALRDDPTATAKELGSWARPAFRWPTVIAGNSRAGLAELGAWGVARQDTFHLPNAVDPQAFSLRERPDSCPVTVGFVGRLVSRKHPELLVDLVADLVATGLAVQGVLVGDGPLAASVDQHILTRDVGDIVERRPATGDVSVALGQMDVLVLPSDHEGMPNVVLEAMATGLAVVVTDVGSVGEAVEDHRSGRIVPAVDFGGLCSAVGDLVEQPGKRGRLGVGGAGRIRSECWRQRRAAAMDDVYSAVESR